VTFSIGCARGIHAGGVYGDPLGERLNRDQELATEFRKRILDLRRRDRCDGARDKAILFKLPQRRGQYFLAYFPDLAAQRVEAAGPLPKDTRHHYRPKINRRGKSAVEQSLGIPGVHRSRTDVATPPR